MKFCPVVSEICRGQVHGARKERRIIIRIRITVPEMRPAIGWPEKTFLGQ
jgi:hypothetical protein